MSVPAPHDVVRLLFASRSSGDVRRVMALLDPGIRAQMTPDGDAVEGIAEVRGLFGRTFTSGRRVELEAHRLERDGDDAVNVHGRIRIIEPGRLTDSPGAWRFTVRGGRVHAITPLVPAPAALRRVA